MSYDENDNVFTLTEVSTQREKICEIFKSTKGKDKLNLEGFSFNKSRSLGNVFYWACDQRLTNPYRCDAKAITHLLDTGRHVLKSESGHHNHEPNAVKSDIFNAREKMKTESIKNPHKRPCQIIQDVVAECCEQVARNLPSNLAMRKIVYGAKKKFRNFPRERDNLFFEIDSKEVFDNDFILKDCKFDGQRIIILTTLNFVTILSRGKYWMMDGTFKVVPSLFRQMYTIHSNINDSKAFPLVFALCSGKSEIIYDNIFQTLFDYAAEVGLKLEPQISITDFEKAAINSIKSNFPEIMAKGCHFHLGQILYRRIQAEGFQTKYGTNNDFSLKMRAILALSFLPSTEIPIYFQKLYENLDEDGKKVADWFKTTYIIGKNNRPAAYPPSFWSCFELDEQNVPRTQNYAESWHHRIHQIINADHVGVYRLFEELRKEICFVRAEIHKFQTGGPPTEKKRKYIDRDNKIKRILLKRSEYAEIELLLSIAANLKLK